MKKGLILACFLVTICALAQTISPPLPIIPLPMEMEARPGNFILSAQTSLVLNHESQRADANWFNDYLQQHYGFRLAIVNAVPASGNYIAFDKPAWEAGWTEQYQLNIKPGAVSIIAESKGAGFFYGLTSLLQLLPPEDLAAVPNPKAGLPVRCAEIKDAPRFAWRGMHLDVCRHFFSVSFVKKYIDLMAFYKMNTFHWHLTDDQGWRIEIKQYPKLTSVGAWRRGSMVGPYADQKFDTIRYGGFYTQEEIKEVVAYAASRHVTVVPEIEMPGHAVSAIAAYPWLSCTGKPLEVERGWGVFEDVFCPKDSTFTFLENVLTEVMALFPGKYIHIGGDECPKTRWKACPHCQALIKRENLKDEHGLQSYFIRRIEKFVNAQGRSVIGWDEILEGGLAPNAAVMSWRGTEGGLNAAREHHKVVMTPGAYCYFDYYQAEPAQEPLAIGGYVPLEKVYGFEPVPAGLVADEKEYILGAQGNLWTEYIASSEQVEYMVFPRLCALAEVAWSPKDKRNEGGFIQRLQAHFALLDQWHVSYAKALYRTGFKSEAGAKPGTLKITLTADKALGQVYYTTDGSAPTAKSKLYSKPFEISKDAAFKAGVFQKGELKGKITSAAYTFNKATSKPVTLETNPSGMYNHGGAFNLVDGVQGQARRVNDEWLGWEGTDMNAVVDLGKEEVIKAVFAGFREEKGSWIYFPKEVTVQISTDGITYKTLTGINGTGGGNKHGIRFESQKARYVRIIARNYGKIPAGSPGAGENSWLFCDEIIIN